MRQYQRAYILFFSKVNKIVYPSAYVSVLHYGATRTKKKKANANANMHHATNNMNSSGAEQTRLNRALHCSLSNRAQS